ncbi:MAG: phenylalanine--tRNA ligase subunit alpha [Candidatus Nanoarchaeia archaeon]|nr:phenylalanine--tRNA ligase subunit alpha [Candidatus Nanoarchaeia archaeon]
MKGQKHEKLLDFDNVIESLSPNERAIIPHLKEKSIEEIDKNTGLGKTSVLRALEFLSNKNIVKLSSEQEKILELGVNGILYLKNGLPERKLISIIGEKNSISLQDAKKLSGLNDNEFKAALGALKKKALINLINGNIILAGSKQEIAQKTLEEKFLESLPKKINELQPEEKYAFDSLKSRKDIIDIQDKKTISFTSTELGEKLMKQDLKEADNLVEGLTSSLIKSGQWKGKKFRRYDIISNVPKIYGGKRHFVNQATDYAKKIWLEMGFKEMTGNMIQSGFWNFDALFTAQDHPVREMQDTFFIKNKTAKLPEKELVENIKSAHEGKIKGSKGWQEDWNEKDSKKVVMRTHTTCLSAQTLKKIAEKKEFPAKYFALGKCFRNETVDWSHNFEFNQTDGIVVDENANFRQLLGYLIEFFRKMGYEKIRIRPGYFPYTEPSLEIDVFHPVHKKWMELGGAGMFRPEVTIPFFGRHIPVLAWGPGFDRIIMEFFNITDLRDMYKNNINQLRKMKIWRR